MSTAYNHMKRSHRSQRGHYMAQSKKYVKNANYHNVQDEIAGPIARLSKLLNRKGNKADDN